MQISVPTIMALGADHIASLIDTAFIGHIGPVGVIIAIFNQKIIYRAINRIKLDGFCFFPDTTLSHASVVMNLYYASTGRSDSSCSFNNSGVINFTDTRSDLVEIPLFLLLSFASSNQS
ncbi:hypothetical protein P8452_38669 [Trifolium repens]|nr:hypothetical protein P8452_38669 [Trifolium repens]